MKQKRFVLAAVLALLVCLFVCVCKFEQAMTMPRLDHALIAAIARDDVTQTARLLAQGANPNACDAPPPPSFWRWMLRFWRRDAAPPRAYPTAMQIAFTRAIPDIAEEKPPYAARLRIIQALHERGANDASDAAGYENQMPAFQGKDWSRNGVWDNAQMAEINACRAGYAAFLRNHGLSVTALRNLALAHYWLGDLNGVVFLCRMGQCWTSAYAVSDSAISDYFFFDNMLARVKQQAIDLPRNAELIAAVRRDDAEGVAKVLKRGADPNARAVPSWPETRAKLLQPDYAIATRVPDSLIVALSPELQDKTPKVPKREAPSPHPYPTALKIAVYRDMTPFVVKDNFEEDPQAPEQSRFEIIKALHDAGANPADALTEREKSLPKPTELESGAKNAADFPRGGYIRYLNNWNAWAEAKFLIVNGMSARAYAELAKYCARFSADEWAVHAYHIALLWNPNDAKLANAARQLEDLPRVRRAIQKVMPADWKLESARPYPSAGAMKRWAVLYRQDETDKEVGYHCAVYGEDRAGFTLLFRGNEGITGDGINLECALYVVPLTGRRLPEIIGLAQGSMAGAAPAQMVAYAPEGNKWKQVLDVSSNQGIRLEKRRGQRAYLVRNGYETGYTMCHADQPRRCDVYAWDGKE